MSSAVSLWKSLLLELSRLTRLTATDPATRREAAGVFCTWQAIHLKIRALPAELPKATLKKLVLEMKVPLQVFSTCSTMESIARQSICAIAAFTTLRALLRHLHAHGSSISSSGGSSITAALHQQLQKSGLLQHLPTLMATAADEFNAPAPEADGSGNSSSGSGSSGCIAAHQIKQLQHLQHAALVCDCWAFAWAVSGASPQDAAHLAHIAAIAPAALHLALVMLQFVCSKVQQLGPPQQGGGSSGSSGNSSSSSSRRSSSSGSSSSSSSSSAGNLQTYGDMHYALACIKHAISAAHQAAQLLTGQGNLCVLQSDVYMRALTVSAVMGALSLLAQQHSAKSSSSSGGGQERAAHSRQQQLHHQRQALEGWERGCSPAMLSLLSTPSTALLLEWLELEGTGLLWAAVCIEVSGPQNVCALLAVYSRARMSRLAGQVDQQSMLLGVLLLRAAVVCAPEPVSADYAGVCMIGGLLFAGLQAPSPAVACEVLAVVSKAVYCTLPQPQDAAGISAAAAAADTADSHADRVQAQAQAHNILVELFCRFLQRSELIAPPGSSTGAAAAAAGGGDSACSPPQTTPAISPELAQRVIACLQGYVRTLAATPQLLGPSEVTVPALQGLLSLCDGGPAEDSSSSSSQRLSSPLVALAAIGGPGSGAQQHLYGLLCSLLKLSGSSAVRLSETLAVRCQNAAASLAAHLLRVQQTADATALKRQQPADSRAAAAAAPGADSSSAGSGCHRSAAAGSGGDAVAYLPSLVLCGRYCLLWGSELQQELLDEGEDTRVCLAELEELVMMTGECTAAWLPDTVNWLQDPAIHSQLSAAGLQPQQLAQAGLALLEARSAAIIQLKDGPEPPDPAAAALARRMRAVGEAFSAVAVPPLCNNPSCVNVSGRTELTLVSGQSCMCGGCLTSRYCGRDCQRAHWPAHRPVCQALKAAAAVAAARRQSAAGQGV